MSDMPDTSDAQAERGRANRRLALKLSAASVMMVGFGFALVPLYDVFCKVVGITPPQQAERTQDDFSGIAPDYERNIKVEFSSQVMRGLPVVFYPMQTHVVVHPGENVTAKYYVHNITDQAIKANAIYSVSPNTIGGDFHKIECFCFKEQILKPGEAKEMPVVFYLSRDLDEHVTDITLSYAFYTQPTKLSRSENYEFN